MLLLNFIHKNFIQRENYSTYNILEICYFVHVEGFDQEKGYKYCCKATVVTTRQTYRKPFMLM